MALQDALDLLAHFLQLYSGKWHEQAVAHPQQAAMQQQQTQAQMEQAIRQRQHAFLAAVTHQRQQAQHQRVIAHHLHQQQQQAQLHYQPLAHMQSQQQYPPQNQATNQYGGYGVSGPPSYRPAYGQQTNHPVTPAIQHILPQLPLISNANFEINALTYPQIYQPPHGQGVPPHHFGQYGSRGYGYATNFGAVPAQYPFYPNVNMFPTGAHLQYYANDVARAAPEAHVGYTPHYGQLQHAGQVSAVSASPTNATILADGPIGVSLSQMRRLHAAVKPVQPKERDFSVLVQSDARRVKGLSTQKSVSPNVVKPEIVNGAGQNPFVKPHAWSADKANHPPVNNSPALKLLTAEKNERVVEWLRTREVASRRRKRSLSPSSPCPPWKRLKKEAASSPNGVQPMGAVRTATKIEHSSASSAD